MRPLALCLGVFATAALAQPTVIDDPVMADQLMGEHVFNLQWIDTPPGVATVTEAPKGELQLDANQQTPKGDFASVKGRITRVTTRSFEFDGTVTTRVSHNNRGEPCVKTGHFTFRITSGRKYWRLKELENCEGNRLVDYLDVFFARPQKKPAR